ncbi:MAG: hypothetical protein IRZ05_10680 [Micromonosporaceae bacterium]|jgi:hypothetical protein|nr:hypothetical protein [Micromonosporaceae bacterium]
MIVTHRTKRTVAAAGFAAAVLAQLVVAEPARADGVTPFACAEAGTHYRTFSKQDLHIPLGIDFKSGPGGTVTASIQYNFSTTISVSISATVSTSAIVASAETTFGINASVTASIGSSYGYSHNITAGKYGHLQFGNWGWRMGVEKYVYDRNCRLTSDVTGTVTRMPSAASWGYRYWETSS